MRLNDDPDRLAGDELEGVSSGQGYVHFKLRTAAIYQRCDNHISPLQSLNGSWQEITSAQTTRSFGGQQQIAGSKPNAQGRTDVGSNQRSF
jgi:hypothetical protein